ncbi:hypothetical protein [Planococcus rifietoensis]|uniref:hypothetical protein n=1 Tax=Planococcus rifietoensis TaxID=200991 RepID=UPI00384C806D
MLTKRGFSLLLFGLLLMGCSEDTKDSTQNTKESEISTEQESQDEEKKVPNETNRDTESNPPEDNDASTTVEAEEIVEETFEMDIHEFKEAWLQITDMSGMERINTITNEDSFDAGDGIIYTANINEYILLQAHLDYLNEDIVSIFIEAVPPDESYSDADIDVAIAPAVLVAILQPEITSDERGDIIINNLGWGAQGVDQETLDKEYISNNTTYVVKNMDGLLYSGMKAGNIEEIRERNN